MSAPRYTYDEVNAKLTKLAGANPSPDSVLEAALKLSVHEIAVLVDYAEKHPPLTNDQLPKFELGVATTFSSPDAFKHIENASNQASDSAKAIKRAFVDIGDELRVIERTYPTANPLLPELQDIQKASNETIYQSMELALDIARHATEFDETIIPLCSSEKYTVESRKRVIDMYIKDLGIIQEKSAAMDQSLREITTDFDNFTRAFEKWAEQLEKDSTAEIRNLRKTLLKQEKEIAKLQGYLRTAAMIGGGAIFLTTTLGLLSGPLAPFVAIGGLLLVGSVAIGTTVGIAFALSAAKRDAQDTRDKILRLESLIQNIRKTRQQLDTLGDNTLNVFKDNVSVLANTFEQTRLDANDIQGWLKIGAKYVDMPKSMKKNLDHAVHTYDQLAHILRSYAYGVKSSFYNDRILETLTEESK